VGASLLANADWQLQQRCLTHRFREQARSHKGCGAFKTCEKPNSE